MNFKRKNELGSYVIGLTIPLFHVQKVKLCQRLPNFILEAAISSNYNGYDDMLTHSFLVYQFVHKLLTYPSSTVLKQAQPSLLSSQI